MVNDIFRVFREQTAEILFEIITELSAGILFWKTMWKETVSATICQRHQR